MRRRRRREYNGLEGCDGEGSVRRKGKIVEVGCRADRRYMAGRARVGRAPVQRLNSEMRRAVDKGRSGCAARAAHSDIRRGHGSNAQERHARS